MGMDYANPMAAILSGVMMLDYLADKLDLPRYAAASHLLDQAITNAFAQIACGRWNLAAIWAQNLSQTPSPKPQSLSPGYNSSR